MRADCLPFASVSVRVNGRNLQELQTEGVSGDDAMTATTYIEAVDGAEFDVCLKLERGFAYKQDQLSFKVDVDGAYAGGTAVSLNGADIESWIEGAIESDGGRLATLRKLRFAALKTTDEKPKLSMSTDKFAQLGTISVTLTRSRQTGTIFQSTEKSKVGAIDKAGVPEKALKGRSISHHAQLGDSKHVQHHKGFVQVAYPFGKDPIATYKFRYWSHKDLQNEGIIDRSPSPVPLEERDPNELTLEEARELLLRQRAEKENKVKLKQEFKREKRQRSATLEGDVHDDDDDDEADVTITSESDAKKRAKNTETVDLTDD